MYRFLFSRRWISLVLVALLAIPACVQAALWQLDRLHTRQQQNAQVHANAGAPPRPVAQLTSVGGTVASVDEWRAVTARGTYDHTRALFVRNRPLDGRGGFYVLTPLLAADGTAVLVNRGWVPAPPDRSNPQLPAARDGQVTVRGPLRPTETQRTRGPRDAADTPAGQVARIDVPRIAATLPYPVYAGYMQLAGQDPPPPLIDGVWVPTPLALPTRSEALHWSYAAQWFIFAAIIPVGVVLLVRRERLDRRAGLHPAPAPAAAGSEPPAPAGEAATGTRGNCPASSGRAGTADPAQPR